MSLLLATALATSTATLPACSWDRPGVDPFMGNVVAAVDRYTDIPAETRARLKQRMSTRQYDEIAAIRRDSITGKANNYSAQIRDMHFGNGTVCREVTRAAWAEQTVERGLVYCEGEHCLIVPTVCRNLSRVTRLPGTPVGGSSAGGDVGAAPAAPVLVATGPLPEDSSELVFDAPGAGGTPLSGPAAAAGEFSWVSSGGAIGGAFGGAPPGSDVPAGTGVPWPQGALPIGGDATPISIARVAESVTSPVPEPAGWLLMLAGGAVLAAAVRRRRLQR